MDKFEFSPLNLGKLSVNASFALNQSTIELVKPHVAEIGVISAAALSLLETNNQLMGQGMNQNQKSGLTGDLQDLDKVRDDAAIETFRVVSTYLRSSDPLKKAAATSLQLFLTPYKGLARLPLDIETRVMGEMLVKYNASEELKNAAVKLDVDGLFDTMETQNSSFEAIYTNRNAESAEKVDSASSYKAQANNAYIQFSTALEQAANFTPNNTILALCNQLDVLRKKYHALEGVKEVPPVEK